MSAPLALIPSCIRLEMYKAREAGKHPKVSVSALGYFFVMNHYFSSASECAQALWKLSYQNSQF